MSVPISFSGSIFQIASQAERNWATQMNTFFQALAANALPRNGGSFTLANDLDLGVTASVYMKALISKTASASATGFLKLAATDSIGWRNNAGTGDVLLGIDASNNLQFNGVVLSTAASTVTLTGTQTLTNKTLSTGTVISAGKITTAVNEVDSTDATKQMAVSLAGATTATTTTLVMSQTVNRSITLPDSTDTLVGKATVDTLINKTLTSPVLNTPTTSGEIIANYEDFTQVATPATPGAGVTRVYSKTDGKLYQKTSAGVESQLGGGGLSGVLATANVTTAVNGTMYECTSTGGFTITLPTIPAGGAVIGILDAASTCSATNFIRLTPATGQSLDGYPVNDSVLMDYPGANTIAYAAAGATSWKLQKQATTMVQPASASQAGSISNESTGTFTATFTAVFGAATTVTWVRIGNVVTLHFPQFVPTASGTGNTTTATAALPVSITPVKAEQFWSAPVVDNGSSLQFGLARVTSGGNIQVYRNPTGSGANWTTAAAGGWQAHTITYILN